MKHYVVHSHDTPFCNCNKFQNRGTCSHVTGQGVWQATYVVSAVSGKQAEDIVRDASGRTDRLLYSFPLPLADRPEVVLETWRDQTRASDVIHSGSAVTA